MSSKATKKWLAMCLAASMVVPNAAPVFATPVETSVEAEVMAAAEEVTAKTEIEKVTNALGAGEYELETFYKAASDADTIGEAIAEELQKKIDSSYVLAATGTSIIKEDSKTWNGTLEVAKGVDRESADAASASVSVPIKYISAEDVKAALKDFKFSTVAFTDEDDISYEGFNGSDFSKLRGKLAEQLNKAIEDAGYSEKYSVSADEIKVEKKSAGNKNKHEYIVTAAVVQTNYKTDKAELKPLSVFATIGESPAKTIFESLTINKVMIAPEKTVDMTSVKAVLEKTIKDEMNKSAATGASYTATAKDVAKVEGNTWSATVTVKDLANENDTWTRELSFSVEQASISSLTWKKQPTKTSYEIATPAGAVKWDGAVVSAVYSDGTKKDFVSADIVDTNFDITGITTVGKKLGNQVVTLTAKGTNVKLTIPMTTIKKDITIDAAALNKATATKAFKAATVTSSDPSVVEAKVLANGGLELTVKKAGDADLTVLNKEGTGVTLIRNFDTAGKMTGEGLDLIAKTSNLGIANTTKALGLIYNNKLSSNKITVAEKYKDKISVAYDETLNEIIVTAKVIDEGEMKDAFTIQGGDKGKLTTNITVTVDGLGTATTEASIDAKISKVDLDANTKKGLMSFDQGAKVEVLGKDAKFVLLDSSSNAIDTVSAAGSKVEVDTKTAAANVDVKVAFCTDKDFTAKASVWSVQEFSCTNSNTDLSLGIVPTKIELGEGTSDYVKAVLKDGKVVLTAKKLLSSGTSKEITLEDEYENKVVMKVTQIKADGMTVTVTGADFLKDKNFSLIKEDLKTSYKVGEKQDVSNAWVSYINKDSVLVKVPLNAGMCTMFDTQKVTEAPVPISISYGGAKLANAYEINVGSYTEDISLTDLGLDSLDNVSILRSSGAMSTSMKAAGTSAVQLKVDNVMSEAIFTISQGNVKKARVNVANMEDGKLSYEVTGIFTPGTVAVAKADLGMTPTKVSSSRTDIATATLEEGNIKINAVKEGTAVITATNAEKNTATVTVVVDKFGAVKVSEIKKYAAVQKVDLVAPANLTYKAGESLNVAGGKFIVADSDGVKTEIALTAEMVSGYDMNKAGNQTITAKTIFKDVELVKTFEVKVTAPVVDPTPPENNGFWVQDVNGWWYNNGNNTWPSNQWKTINGSWYAFNAAGYMETGWYMTGGQWYYLASSGAMTTGWQLVNGTWYYLNPEKGDMATGWKLLGGTWYYLTGNGSMATGWQLVNGTWYYLNPGKGDMATGWKLLGGTWYYLTGNGSMATGWVNVNGSFYYLYASGAMASNTTTPDGYRVNQSGAWIR